MTPEQSQLLTDLHDKVTNIDLYIVGDSEHGVDGLIPRVTKVEINQRKSDKRFTYVSGFIAAAVVFFEIFRKKIGL